MAWQTPIPVASVPRGGAACVPSRDGTHLFRIASQGAILTKKVTLDVKQYLMRGKECKKLMRQLHYL